MNITTDTCPPTKAHAAFTLIDLVVVTAVLAVLVGLLLPALATTKAASQAMFCLNNKKQLIIAFASYASDHQGKFPGNFFDPSASMSSEQWVSGWLDWTTKPDSTNISYLSTPRYSSLSLFLGGKIGAFKCPSDQYLSEKQRRSRWNQRLRSVSASLGIGSGGAETGLWDASYYIVNRKFSDMIKPAPSQIWVYSDEHPDSINDPGLFNPAKTQWIDLPASYHEGGTTIAFADGRAELHKWQASAKGVKITTDQFRSPIVKPDDVDILWMREHSPHK